MIINKLFKKDKNKELLEEENNKLTFKIYISLLKKQNALYESICNEFLINLDLDKALIVKDVYPVSDTLNNIDFWVYKRNCDDNPRMRFILTLAGEDIKEIKMAWFPNEAMYYLNDLKSYIIKENSDKITIKTYSMKDTSPIFLNLLTNDYESIYTLDNVEEMPLKKNNNLVRKLK